MASASVIQELLSAMRASIDRGQVEVPMLPEIASKVVQLTQDAQSDAEDLARLIQSDQPLAGHVMRIANSAAYSPNTSLVSLQQAIARLGMRVIAEIALAATVNSKMFHAPGYDQLISHQLHFSLHAALWSKEIARSCRRNVEASFLAGLLHDIGRPVAIQAAVDLCRQHGWSIQPLDVIKAAGEFERPLGAEVVTRWEMPTTVIEVVTYLDDYHRAGKAKELAMIVVGGAEFARLLTESDELSEERKQALFGRSVFADLNLYPGDLEALYEKRTAVNETLESMIQ